MLDAYGRETLYGTIARFMMAIVGFAGAILFARLLGDAAFGGFYLLIGVKTIIDRPIQGWANACKKRFSESGSRQRELLGAALLFLMGWTITLGIISVLINGWISQYTGIAGAGFLLMLIITTESTFEVLEKIAHAEGHVAAGMWTDTVRSYLMFPLQLALVLTFGVSGMVYGLSVASLASVIILLILVVDTQPSFPSTLVLADVLKFARYEIPTMLVGTVEDRFELLAIGFLLSQSVAGDYEAAVKLTVPAVLIAEASSAGLMPQVSNLASKSESASEDIKNTLSISSVLSVPIFFGTLLFSEPLLSVIFGQEYADGAELLAFVALLRIFQSQTAPLGATLQGFNRPDSVLHAAIFGILLKLVGAVLLFLEFGAVGIVAAAAFSEFCKYVLMSEFVQRLSDNTPRIPRAIFPQIVASVLMSGILLLIINYIPVTSRVTLIGIVGFGGVLYFVTLLLISQFIRQTITGLINDINIISR